MLLIRDRIVSSAHRAFRVPLCSHANVTNAMCRNSLALEACGAAWRDLPKGDGCTTDAAAGASGGCRRHGECTCARSRGYSTPPPPPTHIHVHTLLFLEDTVVKMALVGAHVCSLICLSHSLAHRQVTALRHVDANTLTLCLGFLLLMQLGPALSSSVKRKRRGSTHWGEDFLFRWNRDPDLYAQYAVVVTLKDVAKQTPRDVGYAVVRFADLPISVDDAGLRVLQGEWMFRAARDGPGRSVGACLLKRLSCPTCLQWLSSIIAHCLLTARVTRCAVPKYVHRCDTTCTFPHLWITV
jgi:hypothetical protein